MMLRTILHFLYPPQCFSCGVYVLPETVFCTVCVGTIKPIVSLMLPISAGNALTIHALSAYEPPIKELILKKFNRDIVASKQLGTLLVQKGVLHNLPIDVIIPVPLHWTRYAWRGYNQVHEMARVIGSILNKPVIPLLSRSQKTKFQARLSLEERQKNVQDAFTVSWWRQKNALYLLEGKHIVLIDDLCTTGATLKSCARVLLNYKPASITSVVACRALR